MKKAFSLVELSIVLVILGLLVGGILAGQSLIRASELRAVGAEYARYQTAIQAFRDKYFGLAGDIANATSFWGTAPGGCPGDSTTPSADARTCNGNGDGNIREGAGFHEQYRFWQQLANAGLLEGQFTGVPAAAGEHSMTYGGNIPASKLSGAAWSIRYIPISSGAIDFFDGSYGNFLQLGVQTGAATENAQPALLPAEMWNIDTKLDDGMPGLGRIVMRGSMITSCSDTSDPQTATYYLSNKNIRCALIARKVY